MAAIGKAHAVVHQKGVVRVQSSMRVGSRYVYSLRGHVPPCADLEQDGQEADGRGQGQEGGGLVGKQELKSATAVAFDIRTRWESGMAIASRCRTSVPFFFLFFMQSIWAFDCTKHYSYRAPFSHYTQSIPCQTL